MNTGEPEDRKTERRSSFNRKKQIKKPQVSEEFRAQKRINNEIKQKKLRMLEEELWEDWENN